MNNCNAWKIFWMGVCRRPKKLTSKYCCDKMQTCARRSNFSGILGIVGTRGNSEEGARLHFTAKEVNAAAHGNIFLARQVLTEAGSFLGQGLGAVCNVMNPQRIILGGGVTKSGPLWWEAVRNTARTHALPEVDVEIVPAELGDDAPLWGAAALAVERMRD